MINYYPTYYLVAVVPVIFSDEDEYSVSCNAEYRDAYKIEGNSIYNTYRNINEDIFYEVDEDYVNESIK